MHRDKNLVNVLESKALATLVMPTECIPEVEEDLSCKHGNSFDPSESSLRLTAATVTVYSQTGEVEYNTKMYTRPTTGSTTWEAAGWYGMNS